jgi:hypothetical protein
MPKELPKSKPDYSLAIRYRKRDGQWSEWAEHGSGKFESIEIVQLQMRIIASTKTSKEKQIRFEWKGKLCDWYGNETGKVIELK